jgi:hypothetical protein
MSAAAEEVVITAKTFTVPRIKKADMNAEVTTEAIEIITMAIDKNLQERTFEVRAQALGGVLNKADDADCRTFD